MRYGLLNTQSPIPDVFLFEDPLLAFAQSRVFYEAAESFQTSH